MLSLAKSDKRLFPATDLYNECWLMRLVLNWFSEHGFDEHPLCFLPNSRWYSESFLPTQFLARRRPDPLAESWTRADGVVGNICIGRDAVVGTTLGPAASQFYVIEAKMFSRLSPGVRHAAYFDQAARSVACIAEVLSRARQRPDAISSLGFFVLAPQEQINAGKFNSEMSKESIQAKVKKRVSEYTDSQECEKKGNWLQKWFLSSRDANNLGGRCQLRVNNGLRVESVVAAIRRPPGGQQRKPCYRAILRSDQ
jgi:hypothetical protein